MKKQIMNRILPIILTLCLGMIPCSLIANGIAPQIQLDEPKIAKGAVIFSGTLMPNQEEWVQISVTDPKTHQPIYLNQKKSGIRGDFSFSMSIIDLDPGDYSVQVGTPSQLIKTDFSYHPATGTQILSYQLGGKTASISGNRITVTLPHGTNLEGLIANFTLSSNAWATVNGEEQISGRTRNNFSQPVRYLITSESLHTAEYIVEVILSPKQGSNPSGGGGGGSSSSSNIIYETQPQQEPSILPVDMMSKFQDISSSHWAYSALEHLVKNGILSGNNNELMPDRSITREEAVKLITEVFDLQGNGEISFSDTDPTAWYIPYLQRAVGAGVVQGISESDFGIGLKISRQDLAVMLNRVLIHKAGYERKGETSSFKDFDQIADYAKESVSAMTKYQFITGFSDGSFMPEHFATRAECAMILYRIMKIFP